MANPKNLLPDCGLYRTTKPLPGHEETIPAGMLVYFHNHSESGGSGLPTVLKPDHNVLNRWHFHGPAIEFRGLQWASTLVKMPEEGFFTLKKELTFDGGSWPRNALVQLGYTMAGDPILFMARVRARLDENDLWFSDKGLKITRDQLTILDRVNVNIESDDPSGHNASQSH